MLFEEVLRRLEPLIGRDKAMRLWHAYQAEDADGRRDLETVAQLQLEKCLGVGPWQSEVSLSLPKVAEAEGAFRLGNVVGGTRVLHPFGLREDELIQHLAIFGRSGAGKTNTVAVFIRELVRHSKPFLIFDWKRNYRDLLAGDNPVPLDVYTVGRRVRPLHFNPLIPPPGTDVTIWLKKLIEIISSAYYLGEGVMFVLQEALDHVYTKFGCYHETGPLQYPTMRDVLEFIQQMPAKGRKAMWLDSTMRAVQSLCFGPISEVINVARNDSILDILGRNACLELNSLAHAEKVFFIETLLVWTHHFRMLQGERETFKHCMIIEEAHNILSQTRKETVVDLLLREIRELGEAIVLVDQHPSQISVPAIGNTYCTIALNIKHTKDVTALGDIMHIDREHRGILGNLPMGRAIVKLQSRFTEPFQIQVPKVELCKGSVTDADLLQMFPGDSADSGADSDLPAPGDETEAIPRAHKDTGVAAEPALSETAVALLRDVYSHPLDGVVRRYHRIGISRRRGNRAKDDLISKGAIEPVDVPTRTGKVVLLDFTDAMKQVLKRSGKAVPSQRHGGLVHAYWKEELRRTFADHGWSVSVEKALGAGQTVDLHAEKGSSSIALEVETGERAAENVWRLLPREYGRIVVFCTNEGARARACRDLGQRELGDGRVLILTPGTYELGVLSLIGETPAGLKKEAPR